MHTPSVDGVSGAAPSASQTWTPPAHMKQDSAITAQTNVAVPSDIEQRLQSLTLTDIVDLALRNNPATRISWENARAAAAAYGSKRGDYLPTIDGDVTGTAIKTTATQGRAAVTQQTLEPSITLSYLLFDFGGRSGSVEAAKQALFSADFTHNLTIQNTVLQAESAYFNYMAAKALLLAQESTLKDAQANLEAANERHKVGLATIADQLQAKTAVSQAELDLETTQGNLATTRGTLALALGLPANVPYDLQAPNVPATVPVIADSVDTLIAMALRARPDLEAAEADYEQAKANISVVKATRLPSLNVTGTGGRTYSKALTTGANSYTLSLALSIPIFDGFSREYNQLGAEAEADAAGARLDQTRQQVIFDVFSSYQTLQTATKRVSSADDLLASAQESEDVALGRYKQGVGSVLDLLTAQAALASARAQQVQARWTWETSLVQLAHDAGILDVHGHSPIHLTPDTTQSKPPQ
ncbi:MAG TPA: TolC family protein [Gemmatimonadaceae bacterium]